MAQETIVQRLQRELNAERDARVQRIRDVSEAFEARTTQVQTSLMAKLAERNVTQLKPIEWATITHEIHKLEAVRDALHDMAESLFPLL